MNKTLLPWLLIIIPLFSKAQWETIPFPSDLNLTDIEFVSDQKGFIAGYTEDFSGIDAALFSTNDGGNTWTEVNPLNFPGQYIQSMQWLNDTVGFFGTYSEFNDGVLLYTEDGGENIYWLSNVSPVTGVKSLSSFEGDGMVMIDAEDNVFRTSNYNQNWSQLNINIYNLEVKGLKFFTTTVGYAYGSAFLNNNGVILRTIDRGISWDVVYQSESTNSSVDFLDFNDLAFAALRTQLGARIITSTNGETWTEKDLMSNMEAVAIQSNSAFGAYGLFRKSNDNYDIIQFSNNGETLRFQEFDPQDSTLNDIHFFQEDLALMIGNDGLVKKTAQLLNISKFNTEKPIIYPNPATNFFIIPNNVEVMKIFNTTGQLVTQNRYPSEFMSCDHLESGLYIIELIDDTGNRQSHQLIIQR